MASDIQKAVMECCGLGDRPYQLVTVHESQPCWDHLRRTMARDPAVQAMVLRAAAKNFDERGEKAELHIVGEECAAAHNYCICLADSVKAGVIALEIPE